MKEGKLIINDEEARFVKDIFNLYTSGKGIRSIVLYLNQFGVNKDIRTIGRMLENPVYSGRLRWANNSKMDSITSDVLTHPPIIDFELYEQTQHLRKPKGEGREKSHFLLTRFQVFLDVVDVDLHYPGIIKRLEVQNIIFV
ncbi:recombinase family protein [Peribacillus frigoritolerans]|nr:recombinase family protein [Peribacillus frigoritolerans]